MTGEAFVKIGTALIALIGAIITYVIVPFLKSKTTENQRNNAKFWVQVAVGAAEQIYKEKGQGKIKKQYVVNFLNERGIKITDEQLDILIEAAVYEINKNK